MAYETPTSTDRGRLSAILGEKRNISGVGEVTDRGRLESILGKSAGAPLSTTIAPSRHNVAWANERYIKANTPWYVNALTKGPVGGFLNVIQKPLAFTSSALKETIDVFSEIAHQGIINILDELKKWTATLAEADEALQILEKYFKE